MEELMMNNDDDWRTPSFREHIIAKIEEVRQKSLIPMSKTSSEMESYVFEKAKTKCEYLGYIARLILRIRDTHDTNKRVAEAEEKKEKNRAMSAQYVDLILSKLNGPDPPATFAELDAKNLNKLYLFEWLTSYHKVQVDQTNWKTLNEFRFEFSNKFLRLAFLEDAIILMNIENKAVRAVPYCEVKFDLENEQQPQQTIVCSDDNRIKFEELGSNLSFYFYDDIMLPLRMGIKPINTTKLLHSG